jgi:ribose transport system ATP-binding protein
LKNKELPQPVIWEDVAILELCNVSKTFPGVKALDNVSVSFAGGEIHALLGENGAGKSTLIKILSGYQKADKGSRILLRNEDYWVNNTREAFKKGVQTVYQELQVIPQASVAENIMLDKLSTRGKTGILDWKNINQTANTYLEKVGLKIDPATTISKLSIGQRQLVVIAKAIASKIKILLMDEPTASLTEEDAKNLFTVIAQLKQSGVLVIYVSHVLEEVLQIADRISILRDGQCVISEETVNLDRKSIIQYMIGREEDTSTFSAYAIDKSQKVLEAKNITKEKKAANISFDLYQGEILGFYGLVGAGRTELAKILIGQDKADSGEIRINGVKANIRSIYDAMSRYGLGYVTEDRRKDGLILADTLKTNITITVWDRISNWLNYVSGKKEAGISWKQIEDLEIKTYGLKQKVGNLSGGNQQKVNVAKWLAADSSILIVDEPTVGVDVGAKEYFTRLIWDLARRGKSIILISSDMPEIIKLAGRILIFSENKIVGEIDNSSKNYTEISTQIGNCIAEFKV